MMKNLKTMLVLFAAFCMIFSQFGCQNELPSEVYAVSVINSLNGTVKATVVQASASSEVKLIIIPEEGYGLKALIIKDSSGETVVCRGTGDMRTFIMPSSNVTVEAEFSALFEITINESDNGTVEVSTEDVAEGSEITLTVIPKDGYALKTVHVTDESGEVVEVSETDDAMTFVMPSSNVTVEAEFSAIYEVIVNSSKNGTVTISAEKSLPGEEITISVTPDEEFEIGVFSIKDATGRKIETSGFCCTKKIIMPASDVTVTAVFNMKEFRPTYSFNETVTFLPEGTDGTAGTEGTYVIFGDWPQSAKEDSVLVNETQLYEMGGNTYYVGSDGNYYAKCVETESAEITDDDNPAVINAEDAEVEDDDEETDEVDELDSELIDEDESEESVKYFKVEPIKWRVLTQDYNETGNALLLAENILPGYVPYYDYHRVNRTIDGKTVYPNNYMYSTIRAYLNGLDYVVKSSDDARQTTSTVYSEKGFFQSAFTESAQNQIVTTIVDNSAASANPAENSRQWNGGRNDYACDDTSDSVFLLSEKEATMLEYGFTGCNTYGEGNSRIRMPTEYALANSVYKTSRSDIYGSYWMLRSPEYNDSSAVRLINCNGNACTFADVYDDYVVVVPAMVISLQ